MSGYQSSLDIEFPDIKASGYQSSMYIEFSDIKACVGMIWYPDVKKSGYRSSMYIESSGFRNMPIEASIFGSPAMGLPLYLYWWDNKAFIIFIVYTHHIFNIIGANAMV